MEREGRGKYVRIKCGACSGKTDKMMSGFCAWDVSAITIKDVYTLMESSVWCIIAPGVEQEAQ